MDFIDINIGPARKDGDKFMEWVVKTVQEVTDLPLSLDTTNPLAMEAGLKATKARRCSTPFPGTHGRRTAPGREIRLRFRGIVVGQRRLAARRQ